MSFRYTLHILNRLLGQNETLMAVNLSDKRAVDRVKELRAAIRVLNLLHKDGTVQIGDVIFILPAPVLDHIRSLTQDRDRYKELVDSFNSQSLIQS